MIERGGDRPDVPVTEPAPAITSLARSASWVTHHTPDALRGSTRRNATVRAVSEAAPTILFGHCANDVSWVSERPATTVNADPRVSEPGRHDPKESGSQQKNAVRVTVTEAAILQGFPSDVPWQGSRTAQFRQIGNAVPPPLARAILAALTSPTFEETT